MIKNLSKELAVVSALPFDCYLTGSRFFGVSKAFSDWDFFTTSSDGVESYLSRNGFFRVDDSNYMHGDQFIISVYRHSEYPIDIQLVKNAAVKNAAQEALKNIPCFCDSHSIDKKMQPRYWFVTQVAIQKYIQDCF